MCDQDFWRCIMCGENCGIHEIGIHKRTRKHRRFNTMFFNRIELFANEIFGHESEFMTKNYKRFNFMMEEHCLVFLEEAGHNIDKICDLEKLVKFVIHYNVINRKNRTTGL